MGWCQFPPSPTRAWLVSGGVVQGWGGAGLEHGFGHRKPWHGALGFLCHPEKSLVQGTLYALLSDKHLAQWRISTSLSCSSVFPGVASPGARNNCVWKTSQNFSWWFCSPRAGACVREPQHATGQKLQGKCPFGWTCKAQGDLGRNNKACGLCAFWWRLRAAAVIAVGFLPCTLTCPDGVSSICETVVREKAFSCLKNGIVLGYRRGNSLRLLRLRR